MKNNTSEYTTPESTTSAQNISQTETSTTSQFVRIPTKTVNSRQDIHDPQSSPNISPQRYITFELPPSPEEVQNETQNITSIPNTSVNVLSPTRINPSTTRDIARSIYDPPSVPSIYKHTNKTRQSTSIRNNNHQTSRSHYNPLSSSFFPPSNTNISTRNQHQHAPQNNINPNLMTQHPHELLLQTNSPHRNLPSQDQRPSYANIVQPSQRTSQNPPLSHISTDPLYQMNQHTIYNPITISPPVNMIQPVVPPPQYIPIQQDTFINTSASIPERMKHFDGLDHSYTPEEYFQQVEARLTFAKGEEPQNIPFKYRS